MFSDIFMILPVVETLSSFSSKIKESLLIFGSMEERSSRLGAAVNLELDGYVKNFPYDSISM